MKQLESYSPVHGLFVGINKHQDRDIPELGGCVRDAQALNALFCDSVEHINSTLLLDEKATTQAIRQKIAELEQEAKDDDVVILSFAGHGTDSHRFVCFDTSAENISSSTIGMEAISQLFQNCRARVIIVLLDCCFSGGAAARVWETGVTTRSSELSLHEIAGEGRIILTASRADEEAIEDPTTRHGLFTAKLIDLFTSSPATENPLALFGEVQNQVRVAAQRMGYQQNPRFLGEIDPSFRLPKLVKRDRYAACFPSSSATTLTGPLKELSLSGISKEIIGAWTERFPSLNALQLRAANDFGVLEGQSILTIAPTSSGKTFIGELAAAKTLASGEKVAVLLPYKALVNEKFEEFQALYGNLGYRVIRSSGDWQDQNKLVFKGQYDIAFFTYETFLNFIVSSPHIIERLGLIVLDEAQFISDHNRGIVVELILTALVKARQRGIAPQLVCLSAVIGETNRFEEWLGAKLLKDMERPIPLLEGVMSRDGVFRFLNADGDIETEQLLPAGSIIQRRNKPSSQDIIVPLVSKLAGTDGEKVLVFRNTRGSASGAANYLARDARIAEATGLATLISEYDRSARSNELAKCVEGGVAFHTSDLTREERSFVERSFRSQEVPLNVLLATSTVAAGVNTPASTVIIVETKFYGADGPIPYTVSQYKNMAGRAGRLGFETNGRSILLAESERAAEQLFHRYIQGQPEAVHSSFTEREIDTWAIKLLAQVSSIDLAELPQLLTSTFGGFTRTVVDPTWPERVEGEIPSLIERFHTRGLVALSEDNRISLTPLGTSCGRASFSIKSALGLIDMIKQRPELFRNDESFALTLLTLQEVDDRFVPITRGRNSETHLVGMLRERMPNFPHNILEIGLADIMDVRRRNKKALILLDWMSGKPISEIEELYTGNPYSAVRRGDIVGLADVIRFHLGSAAEIVEIVSPDAQLGKVVDDALFRLEFGLPASAGALVDFPISLERGELLSLVTAGIDEMAKASKDQISAILGTHRSEEIAASLENVAG